MTEPINPTDLEAYLEEALPADEMARIEQALREQPQLLERFVQAHSQHDAGLHSLGSIWRRRRLTCPSRDQLGSFLLGALESRHTEYIRFHLEVVGCRPCQANLADLRDQQAESAATTEQRRSKYFQSSAGYLKRG